MNESVKTKLLSGGALPLLMAPLLAVIVAAYGMPAAAQTINYGALENIFEEPVTTSATGTPQRASEVAADMTIITADQIRQSGSRRIPDIVGMYVPGVNVLQEGINQFDVGMRGYQAPYNPRLLVLIDGRQVFIDDYSRTQWDNLPVNIDDIRQIEVVKGASSALFGSNATSGVVNIITYSPLHDDNNVVNGTFGTQHAFQGDTTLTYRAHNLGGVKLSVGGLTEHEYSATARKPVDYSEALHPFHQYLHGSGVYKVTPSFVLNGEASVTQKKGTETIPSFDSYPVKATIYSARGGWSWKTPYGTIKNDNYINLNDITFVATSLTLTKNSLIVSRLENMVDIGSAHTLRGMFEYRHKYNLVKTTAYDSYEKPILNQDVFTVGGTWLWRLRNDLSWTNAIRYDMNHTDALGGVLSPAIDILNPTPPFTADQYKRDFNTVSANSGLVYNVTDQDTLRATYGRGVQNPSFINTGDNFNFLLFPGPPDVIYQLNSSPYIKPTIVQDFSLGYDRKIPDIYSAAHFTAFYEKSRDLIAFLPLTFGIDTLGNFLFSQDQANVGNSHGFGGEISLDGRHPDGYRWNASYSYAYIHDSASAAQTINYERSAPRHQVRLNLGRTVGNWEFDAHGQYLSSTKMMRTVVFGDPYYPFATSDYATLGGRIGYRVSDNVTVALSGVNLTSMRTVVSPYTIAQRRIFLSLTGKF